MASKQILFDRPVEGRGLWHDRDHPMIEMYNLLLHDYQRVISTTSGGTFAGFRIAVVRMGGCSSPVQHAGIVAIAI
jgi:hypothetical protein